MITKVSGLLDVEHGGTGADSLDNIPKMLYVQKGQYTGTGTYGSSSPNSLTFDFYPEILLVNNTIAWQSPLYLTGGLLNEYSTYSALNRAVFSLDNKTLSWYGNTSEFQLNGIRQNYTWIALGQIELDPKNYRIVLTKSGTYTVPFTGNYYLELHGGGGAWENYTPTIDETMYGGGSGNKWDSITLTKGAQITVSIGKAPIIQQTMQGSYAYNSVVQQPTGTTFGNYSVAHGGNATYSNKYGSGVGNIGTSASYNNLGYGGGLVGYNLGFGIGAANSQDGTQGCVYLEYLGT